MPAPITRRPSGTILIDLARAAESVGRTALYARVSSCDQRSELNRQVARPSDWTTAKGLSVDEVVTEVGSSLNGRRPKLRKLLSDLEVVRIVFEHRDRLAPFGVERWRRGWPRRVVGC